MIVVENFCLFCAHEQELDFPYSKLKIPLPRWNNKSLSGCGLALCFIGNLKVFLFTDSS